LLTFNYLTTHLLPHDGDCGLIGVTPARHVYIEELYGDDLLAQYHLDENGQMVASVDEGIDANFGPLPLPDDLICPALVKATLSLNYIGARYRGLREAERLSDLVQLLSIEEKLVLLEKLALRIPPMMLAGIAESRVLAEAPLDEPGRYLVCRRILLAVMLPEQRLDTDGQPYDYDTIRLHVAHVYDAARYPLPELHKALDGIGGVTLTRPLDCMVERERLYIAEGGDASTGTCSRLHIWEIEKQVPRSAF
jgi:hypothetical protein